MCAPCRSSSSRPKATTSDGKAKITSRHVASAVHEKTGMRSSVMPGARLRSSVASTQAAMTTWPAVTRMIPAIHRAMPLPGVFATLLSGSYAYQPELAAPSFGNQPSHIPVPPGARGALFVHPPEPQPGPAEDAEPRAARGPAGPGDLRGADLQGDEVDAEGERGRRDDEEDHRRAVHGEELVVARVRDDLE